MTLPVRFYYSFRSPYSYLSYARAFDLPRRFDVQLVHKPIRPMVTRGVALSQAKALYILSDCKRIAERLGIPFGPIADPLGPAVDRCLKIIGPAVDQGRGAAFALAAGTAIWGKGRDLARDKPLREVCEAAGLAWADVKAWIAGPPPAWIEDNVAEHARLHWGVPLFVVGDEVFWGQDRLDSLEIALEATGARRASE